jgi:hypothetical protein
MLSACRYTPLTRMYVLPSMQGFQFFIGLLLLRTAVLEVSFEWQVFRQVFCDAVVVYTLCCRTTIYLSQAGHSWPFYCDATI